MSANIEKQGNAADKAYWFLVIVALVATVGGNYMLEQREESILIRVIAVVIGLGLALILALRTGKGIALLNFSKESRIEIRKVVWPTRQESTQTTLIVLAVTLIMGILFFPLDAALVWLVNLVTGV